MEPRTGRTTLLVMVALVVVLVVAFAPWSGAAVAQDQGGCDGAGCHADQVAKLAASKHAPFGCLACHPDAKDHPADYVMPSAAEYFQMEVCGTCHPDQYGTYTYDDGAATKYGGSAEAVPKYEAFADYNTIIDGHGFVREYNEERSHKNMLQDHAEIRRGKYEVCLQCKSTRVAYYWGSGKTAVIQSDVDVDWAPTGETFTVPSGTMVKLGTDVTGALTGVAHQVMAEVTWDGTVYTTYEKAGATVDQKRVWVATYAMAVDGLPADSPTIPDSATCNHCHDPHATDFRLIRKELQRVIDEEGVSPYGSSSPSFEDASERDRIDMVCAQCHVEYVCGKSGVDGINRDYFPWAKVRDLEGLYGDVFPWTDELGIPTYSMDWVHGTGVRSSAWPNNAAEHPIGVPLIKSQHPESETYWNSLHYSMGLSCADCHLPSVTKTGGGSFSSHWFASPVKYLDSDNAGDFAAEFDLTLDADGAINPCARCHADGAAVRIAEIEELQDAVYAKALEVQGLLVQSLAAIEKARAVESADQAKLAAAVASHRKAHVRWENLVVSENSMGFHNAEVSTELDNAAEYARSAVLSAAQALPSPVGRGLWPPRGFSYEFPIWYKWVKFWQAQ
ncbi:MAG: ammonia-forming cytochrome c nitrite reductase subunit c552 [Thermoleophilia bacterium]